MEVLRRGSKKELSRRHLEGRNTPFGEYDPLRVCPRVVLTVPVLFFPSLSTRANAGPLQACAEALSRWRSGAILQETRTAGMGDCRESPFMNGEFTTVYTADWAFGFFMFRFRWNPVNFVPCCF